MAKNVIKIRGIGRLQIINPDGTIAGDSGWRENQVTNLGKKLFLADNIGKSSGTKQIAYVALGTGTMPGAAAVTLDGEVMASTAREGVTYSNVASSTAQFTATFASNFITQSVVLQNIGLFHSTEVAETLFAGYTYDVSTCETNQAVNTTYQIQFT